MTIGRIAALVGLAVGVMAANVAVTVLYMVVYGHVIDPGHEKAYYDAHIRIAAPYCSIVAAMPFMFFVGLWSGGFWGVKLAVQSALIIWATYTVMNFVFLAASGLTLRIGVLFAISTVTQLGAAYSGALVSRWLWPQGLGKAWTDPRELVHPPAILRVHATMPDLARGVDSDGVRHEQEIGARRRRDDTSAGSQRGSRQHS